MPLALPKTAIAPPAKPPAPAAQGKPLPVTPAPPPAATNANEPRSGSWLPEALLVGLAVTLAAAITLILVLRVRQRHQANQTPERPAPKNRQVKLGPPSPLACSCATCGKTLKVKPELAGKKVRCAHCGTAFRVGKDEIAGGTR